MAVGDVRRRHVRFMVQRRRRKRGAVVMLSAARSPVAEVSFCIPSWQPGGAIKDAVGRRPTFIMACKSLKGLIWKG